jgi:hypothetical protein
MSVRTLAIGLLVSLVLAASAQAQTTTVQPATARAGALVTVRGSGFPAARAGTITLAGRVMKVVRTTRGGAFRISFRAPRMGPGLKALVTRVSTKRVVNVLRIAARTVSSSTTATSAGQRVLMTPAAGAAGTALRMQGFRFAPSGPVQILFAGLQEASATASSGGAFATSFRVPPSPVGARVVSVRSARPPVAAPFLVRTCGVRVCLPYQLDFRRNHGGLKATGFTTFARTKTGGGYNPAKLDVAGGMLKISTSAGIAFGNADSQENALAVGVNAATQVAQINTTLVNVPAGSGNDEQAGLWAGSDQDNYAKLYVLSNQDATGAVTREVFFELEIKAQGAGQRKRATITGDNVSLSIQVNNNLRSISASYRVGGGAEQSLGSFRPPNSFFGLNARAGIFATHRHGASPLVYSFDGFSVVRTGPASPPSPPPGIGAWTTNAPVPRLILDAGGAAVSGKLYLVAGKFCCDVRHKRLFVYDPTANPPAGAWSTGPDLPASYPAVEDPAALGLGGKVYVFGGGTAAFTGAVTNAAVFDPGSMTWAELTPMPTGRSGATAQVIGDKIYVVGGLDAAGNSLKTVDVYDVSDNSWTTLAQEMGTARDHAGSAVLGGKLYVFGGRTRLADGTVVAPVLRTGERFDPATGWQAIALMPNGRRSMVVGTLQGCAQVIGGEQKGSSFPGTFFENEQYDPATDTWKALKGMPTPRHGAAAATIAGSIYVAGGGPASASHFSDVNEAFIMPAGTC